MSIIWLSVLHGREGTAGRAVCAIFFTYAFLALLIMSAAYLFADHPGWNLFFQKKHSIESAVWPPLQLTYWCWWGQSSPSGMPVAPALELALQHPTNVLWFSVQCS